VRTELPKSSSLDDLLREILTSRVYDVARVTPLERAARLSARLGNTVLLKREDTQPIASYKIRGAYNRMAQLSPAERANGVIAASAGNHAQGVALAAKTVGISPVVIVMPRTTPRVKVDAVAALGAQVELAGDHYGDAYARCRELLAERRLAFIHAFDDPLVIAGQGTVGMELLQQAPRDLAAVFVPIGGGGLAAGIGAYVKAIRPDIQVIGVQAEGSDAMARAIAAGEPVALDAVELFADGVAVKQVGQHTFPIVRATVSDFVRVSTDEICAAIKDIFDDTRTIVEPAGALAVAGLKSHAAAHGTRGETMAAVISGANMNFDRLRFVSERAELGEGHETLLAVTIPEERGAFLRFCAELGDRSVTEFNYRLSGRERAQIFVGITARSDRLAERAQDSDRLLETLRARGYDAVDLSDNELAKLHVRYMVGGRTPHVRGERVCRFEFPERAGALRQFLETVADRWNISLFHYRAHGTDFGRVLAGFEVPDDESAAFEAFLARLGYPYQLERRNVAYERFLA
jgi:threonine dehydratase